MGVKDWVKDFTRNYSKNLYSKKIKKYKYKHQFVDFDNASSIGFIVNVSQSSSRELVILTDYITKLEEKGKNIGLIEISGNNKKTESIFSETNKTIFIDNSHINWLGFPSKEIVKHINNSNFEILLNLDYSGDLTSAFLCGFSNAKTRVGLYVDGEENFYDFMLEVPKNPKLKTILHEFERYLKMIEQ